MSVSTELLGEISCSKRKQQRSVEGNCLSYEPLFLNFSPALAEALAQIPRTADSRSSSEINLLILLAISFLISLVCPPLSLLRLGARKPTPRRAPDSRPASCQRPLRPSVSWVSALLRGARSLRGNSSPLGARTAAEPACVRGTCQFLRQSRGWVWRCWSMK